MGEEYEKNLVLLWNCYRHGNSIHEKADLIRLELTAWSLRHACVRACVLS